MPFPPLCSKVRNLMWKSDSQFAASLFSCLPQIGTLALMAARTPRFKAEVPILFQHNCHNAPKWAQNKGRGRRLCYDLTFHVFFNEKKNSILNIGIYSQLNTLFYEKEKEAEIQFLLFHRERNRPDVPLTIPFFSSTETLYLSYITAGASDTAEPFWWTEGDVSKPFVPDCLNRGKKTVLNSHRMCSFCKHKCNICVWALTGMAVRYAINVGFKDACGRTASTITQIQNWIQTKQSLGAQWENGKDSLQRSTWS